MGWLTEQSNLFCYTNSYCIFFTFLTEIEWNCTNVQNCSKCTLVLCVLYCVCADLMSLCKLACLFNFRRSRDVAELHANMTFNPAKINLQHSQYQCEHGGRKSVCVTTELCFVYSIKSDNKDLSSAAGDACNILYWCWWFLLTVKKFFFPNSAALSVVSCSYPLQSDSGCTTCKSQSFIYWPRR